MITIRLIRLFFLFLGIICGYYVGSLFGGFAEYSEWIGAASGLIAATVIIVLEANAKHISLRNLSAAAFGLVFGFFMAWMVTLILRLIPMDELVYSTLQIVFTLIFCYLGMTIAIKGKDEFNLVIPYVKLRREDSREQFYLLDTSVIIDGRISLICDTGFLEGKFVIPRFILNELQQIADSSDDTKRVRGRRGLDMLNQLKQAPNVEVIIHEEYLPEIKEVDDKLIRLAKILDFPVLTNDLNLNKIGKLEGVKVLNINDLANSMRPVVFPGEKMNIYIKKEGKERNQGVAFLEDGTMVVVENGRKFIGKNININVTSVLQTSAGKMIFAETVERFSGEDSRRPQDDRSRHGGDSRRPHEDRSRHGGDNRRGAEEVRQTPEENRAPAEESRPPENPGTQG